MFGRATIRLGISPHSSLVINYIEKLNRRQGDKLAENVKHHSLRVVIKACYIWAHVHISQGIKPKVIFLFCLCDYSAMPNLVVALRNIGGALCSTPQSLADAHY